MFETAISSSSSSTTCIVLKGPTGCGKTFVFDKLIDKFEKFVRISDIDSFTTSLNEETFCFFKMPEYIPGLPIYNMTECVIFLLNILHEKGFNARYCDKYMIFISWNLPKPNLRLIENSPIEEKKDLVDGLNLKYKPIENYTAFGNFLPRKKE